MTDSKLATSNYISGQLAKRWPTLFNAQKPVPLAIGINDALRKAMPDITAAQIQQVLVRWCNRPRYLAALTADAARHGLDGIHGTVTAEQAAHAAERLQALQTLFNEKAKRKADKAMPAAATTTAHTPPA